MLFDGLITRQKVAEAKSKEELAAIDESALKDQAQLEVEQAIQNLQESLETIRSTRSNIDLAKESLRLTQARFESGMATTMEIMDAQLALKQALNGYYQGIASYLIAEAKLSLVTGKDL